ncbi:MAG: patatin-like phospholipase family protein [Alphaproteobacteria bacterium]|nr:patatin-like phospholipase family protein [Alphaproteobacteria bacterium]
MKLNWKSTLSVFALTLALGMSTAFGMEDDNSAAHGSPPPARGALLDRANPNSLTDWNQLIRRSLIRRDDRSQDRPLTVWSFDGGGIIGILGAHAYAVADQVAKNLGLESIYKYIDAYAGTSTGGIYAVAANLPGEDGKPKLSPVDVLRIYRYYGGLIFKKYVSNHFNPAGVFTVQYNEEHLKSLMQHFCRDRNGGQILFNKLLKPVFVASYCTDPEEPVLFDSSNFGQVRDLTAYEVAMCTSAAPTFLNPVEVVYKGERRTFVDGGVWENDPANITYHAIKEHYQELVSREEADLMLLRLVSFGAGYVEQKAAKASLLTNASLKKNLEVTMQGLFNSREKSTESILRNTQKADQTVIPHNHRGVVLCDYERFQMNLPPEVKALDNVQPAALEELIALSKSRCMGPEFCSMLAKVLGVETGRVQEVILDATTQVAEQLNYYDLTQNHFYDHVAPIGEYIFRWQSEANFDISKYLQETVRVGELTDQSSNQDVMEKLLWVSNFMVHNMQHNMDKTYWSGFKDGFRKGSHLMAEEAASNLFLNLCTRVKADNNPVHPNFLEAIQAYKKSLVALFAQSSTTNGYMQEYKTSLEKSIESACKLPPLYKNQFLMILKKQLESTRSDRSFLKNLKDKVVNGWHESMIQKIQAALPQGNE